MKTPPDDESEGVDSDETRIESGRWPKRILSELLPNINWVRQCYEKPLQLHGGEIMWRAAQVLNQSPAHQACG
jgi:hypothetical protein